MVHMHSLILFYPVLRLFFIFYRFSYITSLIENAPEGTSLNFEGGLNVIEDLDKVNCNETYLE